MIAFVKNPLWVSFLLVFACGQEVKIVELNPTSIDFRKRTQSRRITATAQDIRGKPIEGIPLTFSSENTSVASVDSEGTVRPAGNGNTAIVAKTQGGVSGEAFVKVCLPQKIICDPADKLTTKVGLAAPIKCHVIDCKGETLRGARVEMEGFDRSTVLKEGDHVFIGLKVGDTDVIAKSGTLQTKVGIHVDEQTYVPGMKPGSGGGKGHGGGGGSEKGDPYGGGRYDHILKNMKFKE